MLFNSLSFAIFFPIVTVGYFILQHRYRWAWLLAASCYFYMAFIPAYILILFFTITIDYVAGLVIERLDGPRKKGALVLSVVANVGVLALFKYYDFLGANIGAVAGLFALHFHIVGLGLILPIGLSFHTFQSMSYTIEVYRGNQKPERHFGIFALYVMFYPQLVAGPIERPQNLLHQFRERHYFDYIRVTDGLKLMMWGLFKKVVIADQCAIIVNAIYSRPGAYTGVGLTLATLLFAWQIYCDFSGYSDIAIGSAQVMGFQLMKNFDRPYSARSISEFWRRWHISLSTWFRDYVYFPLGGSRVSIGITCRNLLATFLLSGLWHGASWNYVIWGALHGTLMALAVITASIRKAVRVYLTGRDQPFKVIGWFSTFIFVCFAWIFFRARDLSDALFISTHLTTGWHRVVPTISKILADLSWSAMRFLTIVLMIIVLCLVELMQSRGGLRQRLSASPVWLRWALIYALLLSIVAFGTFNHSQFIYFQF